MKIVSKADLNRILLLFLLSICSIASSFSQSPYVKKYQPVADSLSRQYGIPTGVILGVAIIESGSGTSRNARLLNNHFGIVGKNNVLKTHGIKTMYRQFPTIEDSYVAFAKLVASKPYYAKLKGNPSCEAWVTSISNYGYSTQPAAWRKTIMNAIRKSGLMK